jgi:MFS family permease
VFLIAAALAVVAVAVSPETREAVQPRPRYRPQRASVPAEARGEFYAAALSAFIVFAAMGLFAGLAGLFLVVALHQPSHALAGVTLFAVFSAGVVAQLATMTWSPRRVLASGMALMLLGLAVTVTAVWLPVPSLALFLVGGALTGAGGGAVFKGAVATVIRISPPESRAEALAGTYLAAFIGLSVPIVGAGVALAEGVSPRVTLLAFAIAVAIGIVASAIKLLGRPRGRVLRPARYITDPPAAR